MNQASEWTQDDDAVLDTFMKRTRHFYDLAYNSVEPHLCEVHRLKAGSQDLQPINEDLEEAYKAQALAAVG